MNRAYDDSMRTQKNEEKAKPRVGMATKQRGDDTPSSSSSSEEESSGSAIPSPESSPRPDVPLPGDVLRLQSGACTWSRVALDTSACAGKVYPGGTLPLVFRLARGSGDLLVCGSF